MRTTIIARPSARQPALEEDTGVRISLTEIRRLLKASDLRPHRVRYWLHSQDPEFRPKVARICDLYLEPPPGATVVCVDEKACIQALERKHPGRPPAPGRHGRREFEYIRHGTPAPSPHGTPGFVFDVSVFHTVVTYMTRDYLLLHVGAISSDLKQS